MWSIHIGPEGKEPVSVETKQKNLFFFKVNAQSDFSFSLSLPAKSQQSKSLWHFQTPRILGTVDMMWSKPRDISSSGLGFKNSNPSFAADHGGP